MEDDIVQLCKENGWEEAFNVIREKCMMYDHSVSNATSISNRFLNRYNGVFPFNHTRVVLHNFDETDYINASHLKVEKAGCNYILTQGPLNSTVSHFWLMVWQEKVERIVMLNRLFENGMSKCFMYWPSSCEECASFSKHFLKRVNLTIDIIGVQQFKNYTITSFKLSNEDNGEERTVTHFQYTTWPDFGIPQHPFSFIRFLLRVNESPASNHPNHNPMEAHNDVENMPKVKDRKNPVLVHCSAGIGRSGTFVLVDVCLALLKKFEMKDLNIKDVLCELRHSRMGLIQTAQQLKFSYIAIVAAAKYLSLIPQTFLNNVSDCQFNYSVESIGEEEEKEIDDTEDEDCSPSSSPPPSPPSRFQSLNRVIIKNNTCNENDESISLESLNGSTFKEELQSSDSSSPLKRGGEIGIEEGISSISTVHEEGGVGITYNAKKKRADEREERRRQMETKIAEIKSKQRSQCLMMSREKNDHFSLKLLFNVSKDFVTEKTGFDESTSSRIVIGGAVALLASLISFVFTKL